MELYVHMDGRDEWMLQLVVKFEEIVSSQLEGSV
jgi:hypothetical protein